jgi:hypothetical protein
MVQPLLFGLIIDFIPAPFLHQCPFLYVFQHDFELNLRPRLTTAATQ